MDEKTFKLDFYIQHNNKRQLKRTNILNIQKPSTPSLALCGVLRPLTSLMFTMQ